METWHSRTSVIYQGNHIFMNSTPWGVSIHDDYIGLNWDNVSSKRIGVAIVTKLS